ncbi:MAG: AraC family ligand binding domain-containing protein [Chitinophagaceae bacterium]
MKTVKNTIPVYDICSLKGGDPGSADVVAATFTDYLRDHPNLHWPHRHSFYHIVLFTAGGGFHTIDFERFDVKAGQMYFMVPGQVHTWDFKGAIEGYVLNFSEHFFDQFLLRHQYFEHFPVMQGVASESVLRLNRKDQEQAITLLTRI